MDLQFFFGWDGFSLGFLAFSFEIIVAMPASLAFFNMASSVFNMSMSEASECSTVCSFIFSVSRSALSDLTSKCEPLQDLHTRKTILRLLFH